jgi:hypothetical protein
VSDLNYVLDVDASGGFTGHAFALSYYWLAIDHIGEVMTTMPGANMYQHWMPDFSITANKTISAIEDTALGDMLYGDLEDWYEPAWSANTTALDEYDRRFIHYASLSSDTPTTYVSPLSFQADSEGGGVINYGLSCQIDIDFIISNSSIPSVLSEVLARSNSMNMWGHNQVDNPILDANLSYYFHDTLTIYRQEGMLEEFLQQITRIPFMAVAALFGGELPDWYANGICDTYAVPGMINVPDYDGPLWYPEGMYRDDGKQEPYVQIMNMFDEGVLLRPAVLETSGWDKISSPDDHFLRWAIPAPEIRGQVLRAQNITIGLDWVELDRSSVYVEAMIQSSDLDSEPVWKNVTIQQNNDLFIDLADISGDANGMNLWDSSPETIGEKYFTSPVVLIFVYEAKPSDDDDIIRRVNNLLYSDSVYLRADLDYGYLAQYRQKLREQEANALAMRLALLAAGGIQIGLGISLAGKSLGSSIVMCFWGLEYIVQGLFGRSMMDIALHTILRAAGMDKEQAESWSLWHLFSDPTLDLIAQEVMANLISAGLGGLSAKKLTEGEGILTRLTTWLDGRQGFVSGATRRLLSAINCVIDRVKKFIGRHEWIKQLWIPTYFLGEAVWEAIYELAFEAVDDTSTPAQYIIGPELILFTTLLMVGASLAEGMVFGGTGSMSRTWLAAAVALRVIAFIPTIAVLRYWDVDIGY